MSEFKNTITQRVLELLGKASIVLNDKEKQKIEIAELGLGHLEIEGLQISTYINTSRYCAKELILLPSQTCPEHLHPSILNKPGKQETFRCRWGTVFLYVEGEETPVLQASIPNEKKQYYTAKHEIILTPGEQYTIPANTKHWFQAGEKGAIISEFSSTSRDEYDLFTDPQVKRT